MAEQRWQERREWWRSPGDLFDPSEYGVELIPGDKPAKAFIERHHYSGSYPSARLRVGLYRRVGCLRSWLAGVAVFSVPMQPKAIQRHARVDPTDGVELGRFVLLDEVGYNGESWFLARALPMVRAELGVRAVLSYSDPLRRVLPDGEVVTPGHVGTIYQALNARYVGRSSSRKLVVDRAGRTISGRALSKIRGQERGWENDAARVVAAGADPRRPGEDPIAWLARVLPGFTTVEHPGNHAYVWRFDRVKLHSLPYPKREVSDGP